MYRRYTSDKIEKFKDEIKSINKEFEVVEGHEYFLLRIEDQLLAYGAITITDDKYYLEDIFVKEEERFKSNGSKLINQITYYITRKGKDKLYLNHLEDDMGFFYKNHFRINDNVMILDKLMEDENRRKEGTFGTVVSIIVNVFLAAFKIIFGFVFKSKALVADGVHSISDVAGSIVILISLYMSSKPADEDHPYGHGKIESIAGTIVGVLLVVTAFEMVGKGIDGIRNIKGVEGPGGLAILVAFLSIIIKYILYLYKFSMGKRLNNDAIIADAKEHKSDVISTIGVLVGVTLAIFVHPVFDPIAGLVVSLFIGKEGFSIILETSNKILDTQDMELVEKLREYSNSFEEIYDTHDIILTYSGNKIFISLHVRVDKSMTVDEAHKLSDDLKYSILADYDEICDVIIHIDPLIS